MQISGNFDARTMIFTPIWRDNNHKGDFFAEEKI